jgi:peptidoglycan/xylan/chitin deacetylase (PgdA/CDA1 family)
VLAYGRCDSDTTPAGATTRYDTRPLLGSVTYSDSVLDCVENNVVALSYDDGPYNYTSELLDILKSYNFTATFFISGNNNGKGPLDTTAPYPDLVKRMIAEGHQVASHTWSHYNMSGISQELRIEQIVKNEMAIRNIIGKYPTYMRPPYSECSAASGCPADLKALGYHRILFDLDTQDYLNPLPTQIQNSKDIVKAALAVSGVTDYLSIQHDIVQQSVTNLTSYYYGLIKSKGWKGVTVGECLQDPEANWYRVSNQTSASSSSSSSSSSSVATSATTKASSTVATSATTKASSTVATSATTKASSTVATTATTKAASSTTSATTVKTSATSTAAAASTPTAATCAVSAGSFCGSISSFNSKQTCNTAASSCYSNALSCTSKAGWLNWAKCTQYTSICTKLSMYCLTCGNSCSNSSFKY